MSLQCPHILLIDDHPLLRSGLRMVLEYGMPRARIEEAQALPNMVRAPADQPDVVLLDIEMPGLNGLEALTVIRERWRATPVVMLSSHTDPEMVRLAYARGAMAYLTKAAPTEKIIATLERVLRGEHAPEAIREGAPGAADRPSLTSRQCEVLALLAQGLSNKLIGRQLGLSENTVRGHVQAVLLFLQASSRSEAAFNARSRGLLG